jgi:hypothetical protein
MAKRKYTPLEKLIIAKQLKEEGKTARESGFIIRCGDDHVRQLWKKEIDLSTEEKINEYNEALKAIPAKLATTTIAPKSPRPRFELPKIGNQTDWTRMHFTGVVRSQYDKALEEQEDSCAICGKHQSELKYALAADHDHTTLQFRGLLCGACNRGLGQFYDNVRYLQAAIDYLNKEREVDSTKVLRFKDI